LAAKDRAFAEMTGVRVGKVFRNAVLAGNVIRMRSSTLLAAILGGLGFWLLIAAAIYTGKLWLALVAPPLAVAVLAWPVTRKIEPKHRSKDTRSTHRTQR
jgi:hypothetical protein